MVDTSTRLPAELRRARVAVAVLFFANAFAMANIVPRYPEIRDALGLSNSALGLAIAAMPTGALVAGLLAGVLSGRFGSGRVAVWCMVGAGLVLPLVSVVGGWAALAAVLFTMGALDAWADAASNAHGLRVQRRYGRSVLNSFHGVWSVGAVAGGVVCSALIGFGVPLTSHLPLVGLVIVSLALAARLHLLAGPEASERDQESASSLPSAPRAAWPVLRMVVLGCLLLAACAVEDIPSSWGAALLLDSYGAPAGLAGAVFVAFQAAMTVGRFLGDRITDRYGHVAVGRAGGLLITLPLALALPFDSVPVLIAAFACAGLGTATLFPSAVHAAGNIPGLRSEHGIAIVTWCSRLGFLTVPPLIGVLSDLLDLRVAVGTAIVFGLLVLLLSGALVHRDRR
ncbi:Fucose permease [Actinoalloteichus cyanogriseus DSM 43889]|uniref:Fucose permease n=1 Tax=Actinoalloteichus caeruleus DSM 43889 TaxID=1120930 RepID=A0ABT1JDF4_ACTCY|nr:Fucose permease [Actinoalloteichus caeruleus DSM 43889]